MSTTISNQQDLTDSVAAIREAIVDMENGDIGRPVDDVLADIRSKYHLLGE